MKPKLSIAVMTIIVLTFLQSCSVPNPYEPMTNTPENTNPSSHNNDGGTNTQGNLGGTSSANGEKESHNMGQNCMNCHNPGGSGSDEGVWQVGGTVYDQIGTTTSPNGTVQFWTGPNGTGTLQYTIQVDAKGNFYTSGNVVLTAGLYPAVVGATTTKYMGSSITNGACNSCHTGGTGTARVWAN